ncbi:MAG: sensor histidine kinase [Marmoricola sp.]
MGTIAVLALADALASPEPQRFRQGVLVAWLCCLLLVFGAGVMFLLRWRATRDAPAGWLAATGLGGGAYLASYVARGLLDPPTREFFGARGGDVAMLLMLMLLVMKASRSARLPRCGSAALGLLCAVAGVGTESLLLEYGPLVPRTWAGELGSDLAMAAIGVVAVVALVRSRVFSEQVRNQLALACALTALSRMITPVAPFQPNTRAAVGLLLMVCAVAVFSREALFLLLRGREQAQPVERSPKAQPFGALDEQMHELRASLAGMASAIHLLARDEDLLSADRRSRLTGMLELEVGRLERLVSRTHEEAVVELPVDDLVEPLVTSRRLAGQRIDWRPSGRRVMGMGDAIAEAVNILLVNAAEHAPGSPVRIRAVADAGLLRLRISDRGPGIPTEMRESIFLKGVHGDRSRGQGLGLNLARRLVVAQGGSLDLLHSRFGDGTTFEVTLPAAVPAGTTPPLARVAEVC